MNPPLHDNEITITTALVRQLVDEQLPNYVALPLTPLRESGSSNLLFRLGNELLLRFPRQPGGGVAINKELHWLPQISPHLPIATPEIVALGQPAANYPEHWSVVRWLEGDLPIACSPQDPATPQRSSLAIDLADTIVALRSIDVTAAAAQDPSLRWYRGRPLAEFDSATRRNIQRCRSLTGLDLDMDKASAIWDDALKVPEAHGIAADRWYHSDLVAENLLLTNGRLSAVLDFGGLAVGDPTIDLHGAWEVLDAPARAVFRKRVRATDAQWLLGRAWALGVALGAFTYYWNTMPGRRRDRLAMARSVIADGLD